MQFLTSSAFDQPFEAFADQDMPAGIAYPSRREPTDRGRKAVAFRLVVDGVELEGLFICLKREYLRLGDAAEVE